MFKKMKTKATIAVLAVSMLASISAATVFWDDEQAILTNAEAKTLALSNWADTTVLTEIDGGTVCGNIGSAPGENIANESKIECKQNAVGKWYFTMEQGYTVYNALAFAEPIDAKSVGGLQFNLQIGWTGSYAWNPNGNCFVWSTKGICLMAPESDGSDVVVMPHNISTGYYTDATWTIVGDDLLKLANDQGMITGFRFVGAIDCNGWSQTTYPFDLVSVSTIDANKVTYKDGDKTIKTENVASNTVLVGNYQPVKLGYTFVGWTKDGVDFDLSQPITDDVTLQAKFVRDENVSDKIAGTAQTLSLDTSGVLSDINGHTGHAGLGWHINNAVYNTPTVENSTITFPINGVGFSIFHAYNFAQKIEASVVDGITFRIYAHISSGTTYGGWAESATYSPTGQPYEFNGAMPGICILGANSTGAGNVINPYVTQDQWIDFRFTGDELLALADKDGYIYGFRVAAELWSAYNDTLTYQNGAYIKLESVSVNYKDTVVYTDGDEILKTEEKWDNSEKVTYVPEKEGVVFGGWLKDGAMYNTDEVVTESMTLVATWKKEYEVNIIGAAAKLSRDLENSGIRFAATVQENLTNVLSVGILVMPQDLLETGKDFTMQNYGETMALNYNWAYTDIQFSDGSAILYATINKIYKENYNRVFMARAYVELLNGEIVYMDITENNFRSVYQVMKLALASEEKPLTETQRPIAQAYVDQILVVNQVEDEYVSSTNGVAGLNVATDGENVTLTLTTESTQFYGLEYCGQQYVWSELTQSYENGVLTIQFVKKQA